MSLALIAILAYLSIGLTMSIVSFIVYLKEACKNHVLATIMGMLIITLAWPAVLYLSVTSRK